MRATESLLPASTHRVSFALAGVRRLLLSASPGLLRPRVARARGVAPDEALVSVHDVHTSSTVRCQSVSHVLRRPWAVARRCVIAGGTAVPAGGCACVLLWVSSPVARSLGLRVAGVALVEWFSEARVVRLVPVGAVLVARSLGSPAAHDGRRAAVSNVECAPSAPLCAVVALFGARPRVGPLFVYRSTLSGRAPR